MNKTKQLILKNQAVMMLAQLALFSKFELEEKDQEVCAALSGQIDKTCAVLPKEEDEEGEAK